MKNIVRFETAKRLKEAGFPQPEPERGQVWYTEYRKTYIILSGDKTIHGHIESWGVMEVINILRIYGRAFAPTATDILLQMPDGYGLFKFSGNLFVCTDSQVLKVDNPYVISDNPAEAAAAAWLEIQKQKNDE